ncbi:MAG: hypothetical protein V9F00_13880 [Nocardioides sp.]
MKTGGEIGNGTSSNRNPVAQRLKANRFQYVCGCFRHESCLRSHSTKTPETTCGWRFGIVLGLNLPWRWIVLSINVSSRRLAASRDAPLCFFWQLRKWRKDSTIVRDAAAVVPKIRCAHLELPVVDFVVAVVHNADCQIQDLLPSTNLNVLSGFSLEAEVYSGSGFTNANQVWLNDVLHEAKIKGPGPTRFFGSTLGDAIEFVGAEARRG